jgi:hypothetical protein
MSEPALRRGNTNGCQNPTALLGRAPFCARGSGGGAAVRRALHHSVNPRDVAAPTMLQAAQTMAGTGIASAK